MSGKKRGKVKFRNADEARKARELEESWKELQTKWAVDNKKSKVARAEKLSYTLSAPPGRETHRIPSLNTGEAGAGTYKASPQYTGTKVLGIGTMHKSNAVPIFSDEEAVAISSMRR
jgi:hypothetical protein